MISNIRRSSYPVLFLAITFLVSFSNSLCFTKIKTPEKHNPKQIQVTLKKVPNPHNKADMDRWHKEHMAVAYDLVKHINEKLENKKSILTNFKDWLHKIFGMVKEKAKENLVYVKRTLGKVGGMLSFHIPSHTSYNELKSIKEKWCKAKKIDVEVSKVLPTKINSEPPPSVIGLEGQHLNLSELSAMKKGQLIPQQNYQLKKLQKSVKTANQQDKPKLEKDIRRMQKRIQVLEQIKQNLFWFQEIPTIGLRPSDDYPFVYPYIPHMFPLWQLAPKKGAGIRIASIDTGIAAFDIKDEMRFLKNQDLLVTPHINFEYDNCNLVSDDGKDALEQLIIEIGKFTDKDKFNYGHLEKVVPIWIKECLINKNTAPIEQHLKAYGKRGLIDQSGNLTKAGQKAVKAITKGPEGIHPQGSAPHFSIADANEKQSILQMLPTAPISNESVTFVSGHGSHTSGLISGKLSADNQGDTPADDTGICGIAPNAELIMVKAFGSDGTSDTATLTAAIKKALQYDVHVLNMSLKIADKLDTSKDSVKLLKTFIGLIPYVVAASGNDGSPKYSEDYPGVVEAYPAHFNNVAFDIGSFSYKNKEFPVSIFSQYEPGIGPKFVMPGFNILSSALIPDQKDPSTYVFMDGTSMATPVMTGFVALLLSEFENDFNEKELLSACYKSAIKFYHDKGWDKKVILGTIDMRTALFTLHAIKYIKSQLKKQNVDLPFDNLLEATHAILFGMVDEYSKTHLSATAQFSTNFMEFASQANKNKKMFNKDEFTKTLGGSTPEKAIEFVGNAVLFALNPKLVKQKPTISETILEKVKSILKTKNIDIFKDLPKNIQQRLFKTEETHVYWKHQAQLLKEQAKEKRDAQLLKGLDKKTKTQVIKTIQRISSFQEAKA